MTYMTLLSSVLGPLPRMRQLHRARSCRSTSKFAVDFGSPELDSSGHARLRPVLPDRPGGRGLDRALDAARDPRACAYGLSPLQRHPARSPADVLLAPLKAPAPARTGGDRRAPPTGGR